MNTLNPLNKLRKPLYLSLCLLMLGVSTQAMAQADAKSSPLLSARSTARPKPTPTPKPTPKPKPSTQPTARPGQLQALPQTKTSARLMLLPFENHLKDQTPSIGETVQDTFQISLLRPEAAIFQLISRRHVQAQLKELAFSESALSDPANSLRLGKLLSATQMLTGVISSGKIHTSGTTNLQPIDYTWATVQVTATLTHIETGEVLYTGKAEGTSSRYPSWQGATFTSIIVEAVEQASQRLAADLINSRQSQPQSGALQ